MNDHRAGSRSVSDADLASMFDRRAQRADGSDLRGPILAATARTAQRPDRSLVLPRLPSTATRLLVAAALATASVGLGLLAPGAFRQDLAVTESTNDFTPRFEFAIPPGSNLHRARGAWTSNVIAWVVGTEATPRPSDDPPIYGGQSPYSDIRQGIIVGAGERFWSHSPSARFFLRTEPSALLGDLRDTAHVAMGPFTETVLDGLPAVMARLSSATNDIHINAPIEGLASGPYVLLGGPQRLTVVQVGDTTLFVLVWARTREELETWLPTADQFIASMRFVDEGEPS